MQTLEPYVEPTGRSPEPSRRGQFAGAVLVVALLAVSVVAIRSGIGAIALMVVALVVGILYVILRKGVTFYEVVAFAIHMDGFGRGQISLGRILAGVAILLLAYRLLVQKWRPPAVPVRHWLPVLSLFIWAVVSGAWSKQTGSFMATLGTLVLALSYFAVSGFIVDSYESIEKFLRAYWYGGLLGSAVGALGLVLGTRGWGLSADSNFFGLLEASMIPLTVYYRRNARSEREKWLYTAALLLVLLGAGGAGSRSGTIGAAIAIVGTMVSRPGLNLGQRAKTGVGAVLLGALAFLAIFFSNPNNIERGFNDRGAGRLDFWNATVQIVKESPATGQGLGQLRTEIPVRLAVTPGVQALSDSRSEVSSHNTWLDVAGDLGLVGLILYASIFVVTGIGFLRPHWKQTKQLSTTLFVMMLPVLSGTMLLPTLQNKLAWSLFGLSAALQVPSWRARYKGYFAPQNGEDDSGLWEASRLARWDLRISRRFRVYLAVGVLAGAFLGATVASSQPVKHSASVDIVVPGLDAPGLPFVTMPRDRIQILHTTVISAEYGEELRQMANLPLDAKEVADRMSVRRPKFGPFLQITFTDTDEANAAAAGPHLLAALDAVIARGRQGAMATVEDELRPLNPGEQRYYSGALYLPVFNEVSYGAEAPRRSWLMLVGAVTGLLVAMVFSLLQQRRPRVNGDDDFPGAVGMPLWTHIGRTTRYNPASPEQYAQVAVTAFEVHAGEQRPRRVVVSTPVPGRSARILAMGVAASLAAEGEKVVLVDGQADRPWMSFRLGGWRRHGIADVTRGNGELAGTIRRVNRWRLPRMVRRTLGRGGENLRFVPAGRVLGREDPLVDPAVLDVLGPDVITVLLAPSLLGTVPAAPCLRWAEVVFYCLVEGRTVTFDAEDAAVRIRTFTSAPTGVVLADV